MPSFFLAIPPSLAKREAVEYPQIYPPLGILYLAAVLREKFPSSEISVSDGLFEGERACLEKARLASPEIIGLSFHSQYSEDAFLFAKKLKEEFPDALLIAGGAHPTFFPEECLEFFDFAVIGEAELTFPELAGEILGEGDFKKVSGISFKSASGKIIRTTHRSQIRSLDSLPFPARDLIDYKKYPGFYYQKKKPDTSIISSRGCPYKCTFCSKTWGDIQRARSAKSVADELEFLEGVGVKEVYDWTDEFNLVPKNSMKVLGEIRKRELGLNLKSHFRANGLTREYSISLGKAGFWLANIGIESANERTLAGIKKGVTVPMARKALLNLKSAGVKTLGFFMGFSIWTETVRGKSVLKWEGARETENTLNFIEKLIDENLLDYFTFSLPTPYPGSALYSQANEHCLVSNPDFSSMTSHHPAMKLPGGNPEEISLAMKRAQMLQAKAILKSGDFNRRLWKFYFEKALGVALSGMKGK